VAVDELQRNVGIERVERVGPRWRIAVALTGHWLGELHIGQYRLFPSWLRVKMTGLWNPHSYRYWF
jgi:hypothetical protein